MTRAALCLSVFLWGALFGAVVADLTRRPTTIYNVVVPEGAKAIPEVRRPTVQAM